VRKRLLTGVLIAVAAVAAPKIWPEVRGRLANGAERTARQQVVTAEIPLRVTAVVVVATPLADVVSSTGTLLAAEAVELQAEVSGKITAIHFTEGAFVEKGALLAKLNDADLQARRVAATHELALAERRERRAAELLAQGFVIPDAHDGALNTVNVRRAELGLIDAQIAKTEVRAPFAGFAGLRYVSEGALVGASTRIATLQRIDELKIDFAVPERHAAKIKVGSSISFTVDGWQEPFAGAVYAYDPRIDPETRTLLLRAVAPNPGSTLLPGAFANVRLTLAEATRALLIPAEAVIPDFDATYVFVAVNGAAERRRVVTGTRTDRAVRIVSGLAAGDTVITSGLQQLRDGAPVEVALTQLRAAAYQ